MTGNCFPLCPSTSSRVLCIIHCHLFLETGNPESKPSLPEEDLISFQTLLQSDQLSSAVVSWIPVCWSPMVQKAAQCAEGKQKCCFLGRRTEPFPFQVFLFCSLLLLAGAQVEVHLCLNYVPQLGLLSMKKGNGIHSVCKQYISPPIWEKVFERSCAKSFVPLCFVIT